MEKVTLNICFVAPADNYHTQKWAKWFHNEGHNVSVISFTDAYLDDAEVYYINSGADVKGSDRQKVKYLFQSKKIKQIIHTVKPDIISVHYATSYGTAFALTGIHPYYLSVWGSDIYDFPIKSPLHKMMLKFSLSKADYLLSTSYAMAEEGKKYTKKKFYITPFGVDMDLFNPNKRTRDDDEFVIGTVKSLKKKYGIEYLLKASAIIRKNNPNLNMRVKIAGKGPEEEELKQLAAKLKIEDIVDWLGFISQERAASEWANMDVAVVPSILDSESFGVSAVEAEACGVPVIISDVPGLMEATNPAKSSLVVHRKDENELAEAILKLAQNPSYRKDMGKNGRIFVVEKYELNICFNNIEKVFIETMKNTSQN